MCRSKSVSMIRSIFVVKQKKTNGVRGERLYLALYRKYRPKTFDEVISQERITTTLKNQIANKTTAHAYLFTGSRGTGKTSCAKIMAMAVNCDDPQNGNPCLQCEHCREILSGEATDIVEMDAASNNSVDDVRRLRDEVAYTPVSCKFRVYIIDEVHMLTPSAFNALLKTLEEPPPHIKFILATTELHKVPATISSRCQRFEFRRVDIGNSANRLLEVAEKENVTLDKDAAELISRLSDGAMRDALSLLDRCVSASNHITSDVVRNCAGVAENKHLFAFSEMVAKNDVSGCIRLLGELHKNSKDLALVIDELSRHYRDLMLYKSAPNETDLLFALPEDHAKIAETAEMYDLENILRCLTHLQQCADNISKTKQRKTLTEMCFIKMCTGAGFQTSFAPKLKPQPTFQIKEPPQNDFAVKSYEQMTERERITAKRTEELIRKTNEKINPQNVSAPPWEESPPPDDSFGGNIQSPEPETAPFQEPPQELVSDPISEPAQEPVFEEHKADAPSEISDKQWNAAVDKMDAMYKTLFSGSTANLSGSELEVFTSNRMLLFNVKDDELISVSEMISEKLGFPVRLKLTEVKSETPAEEQNKLDSLLAKAQRLGIEVQNKIE